MKLLTGYKEIAVAFSLYGLTVSERTAREWSGEGQQPRLKVWPVPQGMGSTQEHVESFARAKWPEHMAEYDAARRLTAHAAAR